MNDRRPTSSRARPPSPVVARHLEHLEFLGRRPGTIYQRGYYLARIEAAAAPRALLELKAEELDVLVKRPGWGPEARNNVISHVKGFYRWARRAGLLEVDPSVDLERPRRPRRLPRPMPEAELDRALAAAEGPIRAWLHLAAYAGLRCCEIAPLRGEDRLGDLLVIREQKGGDQGTVPIGPVLAAALEHLPAVGWWFPRWDGNDGPITANQLQRHANRFLHGLGIEHTMHTLRHRFVTQVYEVSGRDLRVTQDLARHRSIQSTVGYTAIDPTRGASVVARLTRAETEAAPAVDAPAAVTTGAPRVFDMTWVEYVQGAIDDARHHVAHPSPHGWAAGMRIYLADNPREAIAEGLAQVPPGPVRAYMVGALDRLPVDQLVVDVVQHAESSLYNRRIGDAERVAELARWWTRAELEAGALVAEGQARALLVEASRRDVA